MLSIGKKPRIISFFAERVNALGKGPRGKRWKKHDFQKG